MELQNKTATSSNKLSLWAGVAIGLAMVLFNLLLKIMKVPEDSKLNFAVLIIFLIGVMAFCYKYSQGADNDTSFGGIFKAGFKMIAVVTLILLAYSLLTFYFDPNLKAELLANNIAKIKALNKSPEETAEEIKNTNEHFTLALSMNVIYTNIFQGVILLLIGAGIFKKNKA